LCFETEINLLRQGWLATGKQAHNARKAKNNGHIWLKQDSELVKIIKEQAREESKACKAFDFHSILMARIILEFSSNETLFNPLTNQ